MESNNGTETANGSSEMIRKAAGAYNYFALAMFLIMQFCVSIGVSSVPYMLFFEVFPFKWVHLKVRVEKKRHKITELDRVSLCISDLEDFFAALQVH